MKRNFRLDLLSTDSGLDNVNELKNFRLKNCLAKKIMGGHDKFAKTYFQIVHDKGGGYNQWYPTTER